MTPGKPTEDEKRIMGMLSMGPASFDEIYEALEFSPAKLGRYADNYGCQGDAERITRKGI